MVDNSQEGAEAGSIHMQDGQDWASEHAFLRKMLAGALQVVTITYTANKMC